MRKGDISADYPMRVCFVFENLVGVVSDRDRTKADRLGRRQRFGRMLRLYRPNRHVVANMWDIIWRYDVSVDTVTYLAGEGSDRQAKLYEELRAWTDYWNVPSGHLTVTTPVDMAQEMAYRPDLVRVYDPDPDRWATYGKVGRVSSPTSFSLGL